MPSGWKRIHCYIFVCTILSSSIDVNLFQALSCSSQPPLSTTATTLQFFFQRQSFAFAAPLSSKTDIKSGNCNQNEYDEINRPDHDVIIVGGSIVGLATAVTLRHQQTKSIVRTHVYERASKLEPTGALLSLFPNGKRALRYILNDLSNVSSSPRESLFESLDKMLVPLSGTVVKSVRDGAVINESDVTNKRAIENDEESKQRAIEKDDSSSSFILWHELQDILLRALALPCPQTPLSPSKRTKNNDEIARPLSLGCDFQSYTVDDASGWVYATFKKKKETNGDPSSKKCEFFTKSCHILIGADGIRSNLRSQILSKPQQTLEFLNKDTEQQVKVSPAQIRSYERLIFRALIDTQTLSGFSPTDGSTTPITSLIPPRGTAILYKSSSNVGQVFKLWTCSKGEKLALTSTVPTKSTVAVRPSDDAATSSAGGGKNDENEETVRQWKPEAVKLEWRQRFLDFPREVVNIIDSTKASSIYVNCVSDLDFNVIDDDGNFSVYTPHNGQDTPETIMTPSSCQMLPWCNGIEPVILIGDAVHAMTPSLGQGANIGLEDALELGMLLSSTFDEQVETFIDGRKIVTSNRNVKGLLSGMTMKECIATAMTKEKILRAIKQFQLARNERVVEVHLSSREQALAKNKATATLKGYQEQHKDFFDRLYNWEPVFVDKP